MRTVLAVTMKDLRLHARDARFLATLALFSASLVGNISTARLELIPLTLKQLELCLSVLTDLEDQLGLAIANGFFTDRAQARSV